MVSQVPDSSPIRATLLTATPLAAAIAAFGIVFGAAATAMFGPAPTIAMSLLVFSGAVQFAVLGLMTGGADAIAVLIAVIALNARNLVLGAVLRPRLGESRPRRMALAWFLVDESFGLAVASGRSAATVLLVSGAMCYLAWQVGTVLGVLGAQAVALESVAEAIFPVLFIGLAAITAAGRGGIVRALLAAGAVAAIAVLAPAAHAVAPLVAAIAVALPRRGTS